MIPVANLAKVKPLTEKQQLKKTYYFAEGLKFYALNDWATAQAMLTKAIDIDPGCDACFYEMGNMYFHSGLMQSAISLSKSAVLLDSTNFWYKLQLARFYSVNRQHEQAVDIYEKLLADRADLPDLYYDLASLYLNLRQPQKALDILNKAEEKVGYSERAALVRVELLQNMGKTTEAITVLEELATEAPSPRYHSLLGEMHADNGNDSLSIMHFERALSMNPEFAPAMFGEADYYRRNRKLNVFFDKMYFIYENKTVETVHKAEYLSMMLQIPQFGSTFSSQFDTLFTYMRTPPDSLTEPLYGNYLMQTGKADSAVTVFKNNMVQNSHSGEAWHQYLSIIYYLNEWDTLKKYATEAIQHFPHEVNFFTMAAIAQWQLKNIPASIDLLEKALPLSEKNSPQQLETYAFLGDLYHEVGQSKKSFEAYERVLSIDTTNAVVLNNYAYYLCLEGKNLNRAYEMSRKAITMEANNATYLDTFGWILYNMGKAIEAKAIFRNAMLYGGKESGVILDHYAEVLYSLGERDLAVIYWELSLEKEMDQGVKKKLEQAKAGK